MLPSVRGATRVAPPSGPSTPRRSFKAEPQPRRQSRRTSVASSSVSVPAPPPVPPFDDLQRPHVRAQPGASPRAPATARLTREQLAACARLATPRSTARPSRAESEQSSPGPSASHAGTARASPVPHYVAVDQAIGRHRGFFAANRRVPERPTLSPDGRRHSATGSVAAMSASVASRPTRGSRPGSPRPPGSMRAVFEDGLARQHGVEWRGRKAHRATLVEALPEVQQRAMRWDVHRFEARLTRFSRGGEDRTNSARRQQALLQRLFNLRLSSNCFVKRRLVALGLDAVVEALGQVCSRYAMRLLTLEDFHLALSEALPEYEGETVTVAESRLLFSLFDEDRSGIVDLEEFAEGLQLLLLSESVVLIAHCRAVITDTHPPVDAMVSALEVDLMLVATQRYFEELNAASARSRRHHPPEWMRRLQHEMDRTRTLLWKRAHKGLVTVAELQERARECETLMAAVLELPENGIRDDEDDGDSDRSGPATPEPEAVLAELSRIARRRGEDGEDDGSAADGDDGARQVGSGIKYETINFRNTRFRADEWKNPDDARQHGAPEHGDPQWYCRGGQVWRVVDGHAPEPVLDL